MPRDGGSSMTTAAPEAKETLSDHDLQLIDKYWRAANYLSVGQIYLMANSLLKEPLKLEHVKPRLLGHWGTTPGLNFIYVHLNRVIKARDLSMIYICGPGHGGPGMVANTYLEGTYSEFYPNIPEDSEGIEVLFKQFSFPGGIPSHAAPETPGSIHEGGELGYAVSHAYGAAFDNPDLIAACVVGDGEAESGPLATSWHSNKFLNPATDGAGANPVRGAAVALRRLRLQAVLRRGLGARRDAPQDGRDAGRGGRRHPVDPVCGAGEQERPATAVADDRPAHAKGLDGAEGGRRPKDGGLLALAPGPDGRPGGEAGARQGARGLATHLRAGRAVRRARASARRAARAGAERRPSHGREPARERWPAAARAADARLPRLRGRGQDARARVRRGDARARRFPARRHQDEHGVQELPHVRARRACVQSPLGDLRRHEPGVGGRDLRLRRPPEPGRPRDGDPERAHVPGLARGLPPHRTARDVLHLRGVRAHRRLDVQPAREVAEGDAARDPVEAP